MQAEDVDEEFVACPSCSGQCEHTALDLGFDRALWTCAVCGRRWLAAELAEPHESAPER